MMTEDVRNGSCDGMYLWICDYRYTDLSKKPIRHVKPQMAFVRSNEETDKRIYYSQSHFVALNAKGELTKKIIPLVDNTGFRKISGTTLQVFKTRVECMECYSKMCEKIYNDLNVYYKEVTNDIKDRQVELAKFI